MVPRPQRAFTVSKKAHQLLTNRRLSCCEQITRSLPTLTQVSSGAHLIPATGACNDFRSDEQAETNLRARSALPWLNSLSLSPPA